MKRMKLRMSRPVLSVKHFLERYSLTALLYNLLLAYIVYFIARVVYMLENLSFYTTNLTFSHLLELFRGGLMFDTSAIFYTHALYILMVLLPFHKKENAAYQRVCKWLFVVVNTLSLALNLADAAYFQYTFRRTTTTVFNEFANEGGGNLFTIIGGELIAHWYFVLLTVLVAIALCKCYLTPKPQVRQGGRLLRYYIMQTVSLVALAACTVAGIRGGWTAETRPIAISNANQFADHPKEASLVLNTPFALIRTIGKNLFEVPDYFKSEAEMEAVFTPIHVSANDSITRNKNVVVFILESFGREYIGAYNQQLENGKYKGYTPFLDELISKSVTWKYSFCNGQKSIDGMPSVLSGIPMFVEPFFVSPYSINRVSGIADCLNGKGYETAFFHGAMNGSMGFLGFSRATKFQTYYGRDEYEADPRTGGSKDYDGQWGIWDEKFLQYFCLKMSEMKQPFMTALFTLSSHHPFRVPEEYKDVFKEEEMPIHKAVRYSDHALKLFFKKASRQPWFKNTIFVLTSDHTNMSNHAEYKTDLGGFCSPVIIYDPSGELQPGFRDGVAQQIDIMPTILNYLGYDKPYLSFGCDLFSTPVEEQYAVNYLNGIYQYVKHGYVLQFDGEKTKAVYALDDRLMQHNLLKDNAQRSALSSQIQEMEQELKAIIQQYMERMTQDRLTP